MKQTEQIIREEVKNVLRSLLEEDGDGLYDEEGSLHAMDNIAAIEALAGRHFIDAMNDMDKYDWSQCYPEVDANGILTGSVVDGYSDDYIVVDFNNDGSPWYEEGCCASAMMSKREAKDAGLLDDE